MTPWWQSDRTVAIVFAFFALVLWVEAFFIPGHRWFALGATGFTVGAVVEFVRWRRDVRDAERR